MVEPLQGPEDRLDADIACVGGYGLLTIRLHLASTLPLPLGAYKVASEEASLAAGHSIEFAYVLTIVLYMS